MNLSKTPKVVSINRREEIQHIISKGIKVSTRLGPIFFYQHEPSSINKIAILLKKNIGSAVQRNYIKRILREIIRKNNHIFNRFNRVVIIVNKRVDINYHIAGQIYHSVINQL
jgi:ribonuclease P protein component